MREIIYDIFLNYDKIYSAYFFGSFGTEEYNENSDVDIAIVGDLDLVEMLVLEEQICENIGRKVDLVNMNDLPKYLQLQIMVRNDRIILNNEEKHFEYLDKINNWYKYEYEFWKKSMIERGHSFD